jgi:GTP-binding protein HflX
LLLLIVKVINLLDLEPEKDYIRGECVLLVPYPRTEKDHFLNEEMRNLVDSANYFTLTEYNLRESRNSQFALMVHIDEVKFDLDKMANPLVIAGTHLSAKEHVNMEKLFECRVIDKFELVLEIFALRAMTEEAKVQISLASLKYESPREKMRLMDRLSVDGAWHTERSGFWGPGESPLHGFDARTKKRESNLRNRLEELKNRRIKRRLARKRYHHDSIYISVVGYTSAGKSTLMNSLTKTTDSRTSSRLFETLDTRIRSFQVDDLKVFVTDTVGFIEDLPTFLIDSFRSTLEESLAADIILFLVDASEPTPDILKQKLTVTINTVNEINPQNNRFIVMNKTDLLDPAEITSRKKFLQKHFPEFEIIALSAKKNIDPILKIIDLLKPKTTYELIYNPSQIFRAFIYEQTKVESEEFNSDWSLIFSHRKPIKSLELFKKKAESLGIKLKILPLDKNHEAEN